MGLLKKIFGKKKNELKIKKENIYDSLGTIKPFATLDNTQLKRFITILSQNEKLDDNQKEAFLKLLYTMYPNVSSDENNIWNLSNGNNVIYKNEDIEIQYEKKSEDIEKTYNSGSVNFIYKSSYGGFVINQNGRNKVFFLLYTSEYISARLMDVFKEVENQVLELKRDSACGKYRIYVGKIEGKRQNT